jgi:hypothetical protein
MSPKNKTYLKSSTHFYPKTSAFFLTLKVQMNSLQDINAKKDHIDIIFLEMVWI